LFAYAEGVSASASSIDDTPRHTRKSSLDRPRAEAKYSLHCNMAFARTILGILIALSVVMLPAGMMGDRADVIFASPDEISGFISHQC
jgi:hypothetical protein